MSNQTQQRPHRDWSRRGLALAGALAFLTAGLGACSESGGDNAGGSGGLPGGGQTCTKSSVVACIGDDTTLGKISHTPIVAKGEPILIGMINQEAGAAGAFPELSGANRAVVAFINNELGGVNGRPIQLEVCDTKFSPTGSIACAQQMVEKKVVAVTGGIDVFGDGIKILNDNGIPFIGGIPVSTASASVPTSFQFSGGIWGAFLAFADYSAKNLKAKNVSILYTDFGPITDGANTAKDALENLGVKVQMIPFPVITTDYLTPITEAVQSNPDAIIVGTADTGCVPSFRATEELKTKAALFFTGACAAPKILESAGESATEGAYFNIEQILPKPGTVDPDTSLYNFVLAKYQPRLDPAGAGTVAFRSSMNLYMQMKSLGAKATNRAAIIDAFRKSVDHPSFNGHPYTCDGKDFPGLPALCTSEEVIVQNVKGTLVPRTGWIDVGALVVR
ncbi:MAG: ABC transporter substrate-binding protein [Acidimicrobiia bacterium]|nr:ABC transporter substrate-binding protein [Acidimicrobiia bacterium]